MKVQFEEFESKLLFGEGSPYGGATCRKNAFGCSKTPNSTNFTQHLEKSSNGQTPASGTIWPGDASPNPYQATLSIIRTALRDNNTLPQQHSLWYKIVT